MSNYWKLLKIIITQLRIEDENIVNIKTPYSNSSS